MKPVFLIILGTARDGNLSQHVAAFVTRYAASQVGFQAELLDVRDFPQTHTQGLSPELLKSYQEKISAAAGYVIVSPEYNHGYPGELKMLLDNGYAQYHRKPFGLCGVSAGPLGGARMIEVLKTVINEYQGVAARNAVCFGNVGTLFDAAGTLVDAPAWEKRLDTLFGEMLSWVGK